MTFVLMILLVSGIQAQNIESNKISNKPMSDSYRMPRLPMIHSKINPRDYNVFREDFTLILRDTVALDCSKFYPDTTDPYLPNGYPGVIMCHGYGESKENYEQFAQDQASYGYSVYIFSMRGQGHSGGKSNLISIIEAEDLKEFVYYVKHDYESSGVDSSRILIMGGSQGAIIPYMAACNGMNVRCMISALGAPDFASNWIENGSIKRTFYSTITYDTNKARYSTRVGYDMVNWIYADTIKWDSLAYWLPIDRDYQNLVSQNTAVPIMIENTWQDYFFNTYGIISTMPYVQSQNRYYFGAVAGHGGDVSETENIWHENFYNEWFFYWLFDIENGILTRPIYHFASTSFPVVNNSMWSFVHDSSYVWPPAGLSDLKLYFNPNRQLKTTANVLVNDTIKLLNTVTDGLNLRRALDEQFTRAYFDARFTKSQLIFTSPVLINKVRMIGTPAIKLDYSSDMNRCQFNFQIYEVQGSEQKLITRVNYTDRYNKTTHNLRKNVQINGISHSHIFQQGNRIRIIITNLDTSPNDSVFLGTNPYVLPVLDSGKSNIFLSSNSYITLPVQLTNLNSGINVFADENPELVSNDNNNPVTFNLNQNYPNPFNPSTTIKYSVPKNTFVTLKVYDICGKEIAALVNSQISAGSYSVIFNSNAYNLSSGIYFYKLTAGNEIAIKKLMLIK